MRTLDLEKEKKLIQDLDGWPHLPILPVKNYALAKPGEMPETGIIFSDAVAAGKKIHVYIVNMWGLRPGVLEKAQKMEYESLDAMVAAGWIGD